MFVWIVLSFRTGFITRISILSFPFPPSLKTKNKHLGWCHKELCGQYGLLRAMVFSWVLQEKEASVLCAVRSSCKDTVQ